MGCRCYLWSPICVVDTALGLRAVRGAAASPKMLSSVYETYLRQILAECLHVFCAKLKGFFLPYFLDQIQLCSEKLDKYSISIPLL